MYKFFFFFVRKKLVRSFEILETSDEFMYRILISALVSQFRETFILFHSRAKQEKKVKLVSMVTLSI